MGSLGPDPLGVVNRSMGTRVLCCSGPGMELWVLLAELQVTILGHSVEHERRFPPWQRAAVGCLHG